MMFKSLFFKTKNKIESQEDGRSMVEMLGVLAIIGVLSIGGIAGYSMAMNRYRANEIIDTAAKVSVIAMSSNDCLSDDYGCAYMDDVTQSQNVAGVSDMVGHRNGLVAIDQFHNISEGTYKALQSIAGNKFVGGSLEGSILLNFEMY